MKRFFIISLLLCLFPAVAQAHSTQSLTGTLVERHTDIKDGETPHVDYSLRTADGKEFTLTDDQRQTLVGQQVTIVDDQPSKTDVQGRATALSSTRVAGPTSLGPHKTAVLMVNFTDNQNTPVTAEQIRQKIFTNSNSVNAFYQAQSNGAVSVVGRDRPDGDVYGWYQLPISSAGCDVDAIANAARQAANAGGVSLTGYDHVIYYFPTVNSCQFGGLGDLPGSESWINGYNQTSLFAHELGHNMGTHHAASATASCASAALNENCAGYTEYGDPFDVMGSGGNLMSSWHRMQLGQLSQSAQTVVTDPGTYNIGSPNDFGSSATKLLMIPRKRAGETTSEYYAVEIRSTLNPFDSWGAGADVVNGVTIRLAPSLTTRKQTRLIDTNPGTATFSDAPLASGKSFTDAAYGITINNLTSANGSATVSVSVPKIADTVPPSTPGTLNVVTSTSAQQLSWSPSTDDEALDRYEILRNDALIGTTKATSFSDTAFVGVDSATYNVIAVDVAGNRSAAASATVLLPDTIAPGAATAATIARNGTTAILRWKDAPDNRGVQKYQVTRDGSVVATVNTYGYNDTKAGNAAHTYLVKAIDNAGNVGPAVTLNLASVGGSTTPPKPAAKVASSKVPRSGKITFSMNKATKLTVKVGSKTVKKASSSKVSYTVPKQYRKSTKSLKITVVGSVAKKTYTTKFTVKRGVIKRS